MDAESPCADTTAPQWDLPDIDSLIAELWRLRDVMRGYAARLGPWTTHMAASRQPSATNLAHYLALREVDLRALQSRLARLGVSSLGRSENHVLANLDKVLGILHRLAGRAWTPLQQDEPAGFHSGAQLLEHNATALFGAPSEQRRVRIMVTLPGEAATDAAMGGRAECVMLNKGPHILDAMRTLDDILRRMQTHQSNKRPMLRKLQAWKLALTQQDAAPDS
jgi:hypothetical protein